MLLIQAAPSNPLNDATWLFPALEVWHILGFAFSVGMIALVDFRLLGIGLLRQDPKELAKDLAPWTLFGLVNMLLSGPLMFATDPDMYYLNHSFQIKMTCLVLAIVIHYTVRRKRIDSGTAGKGIALLSLVLWAGVLGGGIFIGFFTTA